MSNVTATWDISCYCDCPACEHWFDILEQWNEQGEYPCELAEHSTEASKDIEVWCPKCDHEFKVDLEW